MQNMKSTKLLPFFAAVLLVGPACTLDPPKGNGGAGDAGTATCNDDPDDGYPAAAPDGGAGTSVEIAPVACTGGPGDPKVEFKYASGYQQDPKVVAQVQTTLGAMTLYEKATQMRGTRYLSGLSGQTSDIQRSYDTTATPIRGYRYRDASRGMNLGEDMEGAKPNGGTVNGAQVGFSTAFPVSMARGAAFDLDLEYAIGEAIGDELQAAAQSVLLAPCMNILRHPLWGRAQETYGEDSYHIGRLASAMTVGVQRHIAANAKHFMAYNIENERPSDNSSLDEQTLREIYGRHFRMVIQDGGVASIMSSYNLVNGTKTTQSKHLLTDVLRTDFGFKGFVLSDWWAMPNDSPNTDATTLRSTAVEAVHAGLDIELPWGLNYGQLEGIVNSNGGLGMTDIDAAVSRILEQKYRFNSVALGNSIGLGSHKTTYGHGKISCNTGHINLAQRAALESMVLLKNKNNDALPIKSSIKKIAVLGVTVDYKANDGGGSTGGTINFATDAITGDKGSSRVFHEPSKGIGPFAGLTQVAKEMGLPDGSVVTGSKADDAADADFIVVMAGLTPQDEGEVYTGAGDRDSFALDAKQDAAHQGIQNKLIADVAALKKPMVVVLEGGSVIDMPWLNDVPAVVMAWYPGMVGGLALAKLLFGQANFSGKLPFTWGTLDQYPQFKYDIDSHTTKADYYLGYRMFEKTGKTPVFPFGHGLSYTTFQYTGLQLGCSSMSQGATLPVVVNVKNTGDVAGDEIALVFVSFVNTQARRAAKELKGFARVSLAAHEEKQITIPVRLADLDYFDMTKNKWVVESGQIKIMVGGRSTDLPLEGTVTVSGYEH
jgi:beta-glucosidase